MRQSRLASRIPTAAVVLLAALVLAACTSTPEPDPGPTRLTEPVTYLTAVGQSADQSLGAVTAQLGVILSNSTRTDRYGTWQPLDLTLESSLLTIDPDTILVPEEAEITWSQTWVENAWEVVAAFLVQEWVDSELVWDDTQFNRALVAERIAGGNYFGSGYGGTFMGFLDPETAPISFTLHGSWAMDQDFEDWRQNGLTAPSAIDPGSDAADGERYLAQVSPAEPAYYVADWPRTYITGLELISIAPGTDTAELELTASLGYYRPIRVEGVSTPRYERSHAYITFVVGVEDQTSILLGFRQGSVTHSDAAYLVGEDLLRLPLLTDTTVPRPESGPATELGIWTYSPPGLSIPDDDQSCEVTLPDDYAGDFTAYDLPEAAPGVGACLLLWAYPTDTIALADWWISPSTTAWGYENGYAIGAINVESYTTIDDVAFDIIDQKGQRFRAEATVAAGTGQAFAAALADSLHLTAGGPPAVRMD
jgi:hypothetical protein